MPITIVNYGDTISPGSQPVLVFPIVANQILAAINLVSTWSNLLGTGTEAGSYSGVCTGPEGTEDCSGTYAGTISISGTDDDIGTPDAAANITNPGAGAGLRGYQNNKPIAGQLANLAAFVSKDGGALVAGTGALSEISDGYYKYVPSTTETDNPPTPDSSNTGTIVVRVRPTNPLAVADFYIEETMINLRLKPPGHPQAILSPASGGTFQELINPTVDDLKAFIRSALRDLLGNQMVNKPTFRKD